MKKLLCIVLVVAVMMVGLASVGMAAFPEKGIDWVIWSNPGGGSDITARTIGIPLRKEIGVPLVVLNMSGGSGARAITYIQNEKADGYNLLFVTNTLITTLEKGAVSYKIEDFEPVFLLNADPQTIVVSAKSGINSIDDLVALGKKKTLKWGLSHLGGNDHVAINTFAKEAGVKYDPIVFQGGSETMVGALSGVIDVFISNPSEVMGQVEAGSLKIIGTMSDKRLSILPDAPTLKEKGYNVVFCTWRGVVVKKGTDPKIVKQLEEYFFKSADTSIYRNFLKENGMEYDVRGAAEFKQMILDEWNLFSEGLKELGLTKKE